MELILWRHAEAQALASGMADVDRALTARGQQQAARMAAWLDRQLPAGTRVLASPARRTVQTAQALPRRFKLQDELLPGASADALLQLAGWPDARAPVLIVGHQPTLGQAVARLLGLADADCAIKKGAVWWLRSRQRAGTPQTVVVAVQAAQML
jgi:phosphohistidine phosphatase